jgi:hypothetical protein
MTQVGVVGPEVTVTTGKGAADADPHVGNTASDNNVMSKSRRIRYLFR